MGRSWAGLKGLFVWTMPGTTALVGIMQEERPYELGTSHSDRHRRTRNREGDPR